MRTRFLALRTIFYVKLIMVSLFFCAVLALQAQETKAQPKTDIRVNKQFDDKGNLVRYDSVYTWTYNSGTVPAGILHQRLNARWERNYLEKYTDSLWRSMIPADMYRNMFLMNRASFNLAESIQEALKRLPQPVQKQFYQNTPGSKKKAAKSGQTFTL